MNSSAFAVVVRREAIERAINYMQVRSNRNFSDEAIKRIESILMDYEFEDGVSIFMCSPNPEDKERIGYVDLGKENMVLWWGENINPISKKYALGISFSYKGYGEIIPYSKVELIEEFPFLKDYFESEIKRGDIFCIYVYAKANRLYKDVRDLGGKWLCQIPEDGRIDSNKAIAKVVKKDIYIYQPGVSIRTKRYAKKISVF